MAKRLGVSRHTIYKWIRDKHLPAYKLGHELRVKESDLARFLEERRTADKVEVEIRWEDQDGRFRSETLRFRGEEIDRYEEDGVYFTLYEGPGGFRVHVDHAANDEPAYLHPTRTSPYTGEMEYPTYTAEELVEEYPAFGNVVGVLRVRDID